MRRATLLLFVLSLPVPAWADWMQYGVDEDGTDYFLDPETLQIINGNVRVWVLNNYPTKRPDGNMSAHAFQEIDCTQRRMRVLSFAQFAEPFAGGRILFSTNERSEWMFVAPSTMGARLMTRVCSNEFARPSDDARTPAKPPSRDEAEPLGPVIGRSVVPHAVLPPPSGLTQG